MILKLKRGLVQNLPTEAELAEPLVAERPDGSVELYIGQGVGKALKRLSDIHVSPTQPAINSDRTLWYDTTSHLFKYYDAGSLSWKSAPAKIGETLVDETNKADKTGLVFNATTNKFEYVPIVGFLYESVANVRSAPQRTFTVPQYQMGNNSLTVLVEGVEVSNLTDYVEVDNTTIEFNYDIPTNLSIKVKGISTYTTGIVSDINDSTVSSISTWSSNKVNTLIQQIESDIKWNIKPYISDKVDLTLLENLKDIGGRLQYGDYMMGYVGKKDVDEITAYQDGALLRYSATKDKFEGSFVLDNGEF